jgi:hypothetical protein
VNNPLPFTTPQRSPTLHASSSYPCPRNQYPPREHRSFFRRRTLLRTHRSRLRTLSRFSSSNFFNATSDPPLHFKSPCLRRRPRLLYRPTHRLRYRKNLCMVSPDPSLYCRIHPSPRLKLPRLRH